VPRRRGVSWSVILVKPGKPIAATYSRVSNPNDPRDASLDTQEEAQVALWERLGYAVPREYRFRERYTGMDSIYDRPILNQVRDLIASGRVQGVSAYDTDRLARDPNELLTVVRDNIRHKIETKFVQCDHSMEGRIGELVLYMKGFASALEYDAIRDRTMRGRQKILQQGKWVGGGKPKYGLIFVKDEMGRVTVDRRRVANPDTAPVVRRIFELIASGQSTQQVADQLSAEGIPTPFAYARHARAGRRWQPTQVGGIVRDRTYIGEAKARGTVPVDGRYPCGARRHKRRPAHEQTILANANTEALVSRELFDRANLAVTARRAPRGRPGRKTEFLVRGVIYCGACGHKLTPTVAKCKDWRNGRPYTVRNYRCHAFRRKDPVDCRAILGAQWIETMAWGALEREIMKPGLMERLIGAELKKLETKDGTERMAGDLRRAEERRRKIDRTVKQLIDAQAEADSKLLVKAIKDKLAELDREADDLDCHIASLRLRVEAAGDRRRIVQGMLSVLDPIRDRIRQGIADAEEKREIIDMLEARVYAWLEGGRRRVRVELPVGLHCANSDGSTSRIRSRGGSSGAGTSPG
jgi:DNA invertase Pin-like site-specific DNA recombinase